MIWLTFNYLVVNLNLNVHDSTKCVGNSGLIQYVVNTITEASAALARFVMYVCICMYIFIHQTWIYKSIQ